MVTIRVLLKGAEAVEIERPSSSLCGTYSPLGKKPKPEARWSDLCSRSKANIPERPTVLIWKASECLKFGQLKEALSPLILKNEFEYDGKVCLCEIRLSDVLLTSMYFGYSIT